MKKAIYYLILISISSCLIACKKSDVKPVVVAPIKIDNTLVGKYYLYACVSYSGTINTPSTIGNDSIYLLDSKITNPIKPKKDTLVINSDNTFYYGKVRYSTGTGYKSIIVDFKYMGNYYLSDYRKND